MSRAKVIVTDDFVGSMCVRGKDGQPDGLALSAFIRGWLQALRTHDPSAEFLRRFIGDDGIAIAVTEGYVVRDGDRLFLTGPRREKLWMRRPLGPKANTYAIEAVGRHLVKVGRATDVGKRLKHLQTASPHKLSLYGSVPGDWEREIHGFLDGVSARVSGEWFLLNEDTRKILSDYNIGAP